LVAQPPPIAAPVIPTAQREGPDWNSEFQNILDMPVSTVEERIERQNRLKAFYDEFMRNVIEVGRVIVDEHSIPDANKTYKSMDVGGIAGGSKTIARNLFFKFAIDMHGIYGGDEWSRKGTFQQNDVQNHDATADALLSIFCFIYSGQLGIGGLECVLDMQ
jgi:hypothetical protein